MKAKFTLGDVMVSLPIENLTQQTCYDSSFDGIAAHRLDINALIMANRANREIKWYKYDEDKFLHISVPTDLITWED